MKLSQKLTFSGKRSHNTLYIFKLFESIVPEIVPKVIPEIVTEIVPEFVPETYFEERYLGGKRCGTKEATTLWIYSSSLTLFKAAGWTLGPR